MSCSDRLEGTVINGGLINSKNKSDKKDEENLFKKPSLLGLDKLARAKRQENLRRNDHSTRGESGLTDSVRSEIRRFVMIKFLHFEIFPHILDTATETKEMIGVALLLIQEINVVATTVQTIIVEIETDTTTTGAMIVDGVIVILTARTADVSMSQKHPHLNFQARRQAQLGTKMMRQIGERTEKIKSKLSTYKHAISFILDQNRSLMSLAQVTLSQNSKIKMNDSSG